MIGLDAIQGKQGGPLNILSNKPASGSDFESLFAKAGISGASAKTGQGKTTAAASGAISTSFATAAAKLRDALAAFEKEAHKTPAERAHDQILAKHQLTEDGYKALPPDQKSQIDQEIVERTRLLMKNGQTAGATASDPVGTRAITTLS